MLFVCVSTGRDFLEYVGAFLLNCHRLNSWICHKRITSNTFARNCFHRSRMKVMGSTTIRHSRSMCGSNFSGLVTCFCWSVPSSEALSGSDMCEDGFAGDDAPNAVCPSIDDNPEMPGTMDQKDSNERAEGGGWELCVRLQCTDVSTC